LVKENPATPITSCGGSEQPPSAPTWLDTWDHGIDLIRSIWKWLVFGVLLSAAISMFIPADGLGGFINNYAGGPVGASLLALLISVPLYVCATASVPIAAALVHGGLPLGAALVFLMAGPATNVATIGAVRSELGTRTTIVYLGTVIIGSLLLGLGFDFVLQSTPMSHGGHEHYTWWAQLSAILLIGMWLYFLWEDISMSNTTNQTSDNTKVFNVEGMTCGGCVNRLKKVLERTDGVEAATVTLEPGEAHVTSTLSDAAIIQIIEGAGFDVPQAS
jgi:copper chaperone CopZ